MSKRLCGGPVLLGATAGILAWLAVDMAFDARRPDGVMPEIVYATSEELDPWDCPSGANCLSAKAFYMPERRRIYLHEDWSPKNFHDLGVLLHEFVHHLQTIGKIEFGCDPEIELPAYQLQEAFYQAHHRNPDGYVPSEFTRFTRYSCIAQE